MLIPKRARLARLLAIPTSVVSCKFVLQLRLGLSGKQAAEKPIGAAESEPQALKRSWF